MNGPSSLLPIDPTGQEDRLCPDKPVLLVYERSGAFGAVFQDRWEGLRPAVVPVASLKQCQEQVLRHRHALLLLEVRWEEMKSRLTLLAWVRRYRPKVRTIVFFPDAMRLPPEQARRWQLALIESGAVLVLFRTRRIDAALAVARNHFAAWRNEKEVRPHDRLRLPLETFARKR
jgi:hypothetical protein